MASPGLQTVSSTLLSTSTLSALSNSSSLLDGVDLDIVEEIIERAPRSATTFPLVYRAYGQILEEHGLNASQDSKYYNFLLKLGVIRAASWGEKWDLFKATRDGQGDNTQGISPRRPSAYRSAVNRRPIADKIRLPFLASASSDLDEGFEPSNDGNIESILGLHRESPRKVLSGHGKDRSRSLVGHTPSPSLSVVFDNLTFNPPYRTSTPVYAQYRGQDDDESETSPGLPPYSVSDVSQRLDTETSTPSTPRARQPFLALEVMEKWDARTEREMEGLADDFHRLGLMGRCLDVWSRAFDWIRTTKEQIDGVRNGILLRQSLAKWKEAYEFQLTLPGTADRHRELYLQKSILTRWAEHARGKKLDRAGDRFVQSKENAQVKAAWKRWRIEVTRRRTERWQKEVGKKEKSFVRKRNTRLVTEAFDYWYDAKRDQVDTRRAERFLTDHTQRHVLDLWLKKTALSRRLQDVLRERDEISIRSAFGVWRRNVRLADAEQEIAQKQAVAIVQRSWDVWSYECQMQRKAKAFDRTRLLRLTIGQWVKRSRQIAYLYDRADNARRTGVMRDTMHVWITKERGALYGEVRGVRLLQNAVAVWKRRKDSIQAQKDVAAEVAKTFERAAIHRTFSRWRAKVGAERQRHLRAILHHEQLGAKSVGRALAAWRASAARIRANQATAVKAKAFFDQRQALRVWRDRLTRRRQEAWIEDKRVKLLHDAFDVWRSRLSQKREDDAALEGFWDRQDQRLVGHALTKWTHRVVEIKSREHRVLKKRHTTLKRNALKRWITSAKRIKAAQELMQSFMQVRTEGTQPARAIFNIPVIPDNLRSTLLIWQNAAIRLRSLRLTAETSLVHRQDRLLAHTFSVWRDAYRERALSAVEQEVTLRGEDALLFAVWDQWKARSTRLPEIAFTKKRILKTAWSKWRDTLQMRDKERSMVIPRDQQLLLDVFAVWREATRRKIALNAVRRRGRVRPGGTEAEPARRIASDTHRPRSSLAIVPVTAPTHHGVSARDRAHRRVSVQPSNPATSSHAPKATDAESTASEPAYSRLRSELYGRKRGGSEEPEERRISGGSTSELVRQLRGALR